MKKEFGSGIRDGKNSDPGFGMEKIRIQDQYPGSVTLLNYNIPVSSFLLEYRAR
jgi:hypothetical protein